LREEEKRRAAPRCPAGRFSKTTYLFGRGQIDLVDELLDEDRIGDLTLANRVRAAGVDDGEVGNADEAEDDSEVRTLKVVGLERRPRRVLAAAGDDDRDLLAGCKALEPFWAKGEGLVEADDVVDPGLEDGRDVEVVHRGGDDDFVGGEELANKLVGDLEGSFVLGGVLIGSAEGAGDPREVDVGNLGGSQVAGDDFAADVVGLPLGREVVTEFAGDGVVAAGADVDL